MNNHTLLPTLAATFALLSTSAATSAGAFDIDLNALDPSEAVLFPFDDRSISFRHGLQLELVQARKYEDNPVLERGGPHAPDAKSVAYYGTIIQIGDTLHMWYLGAGGDAPLRVCYATSQDGFHWDKPDLGLVEFQGNRNNNLVDLDWQGRAMACCVIHEPHDPDPARRFKIFSEVESPTSRHQGHVAFSPDGLRWATSPRNPVTHVRIEPTGLVRRHGCYYVIGQNAGTDRAFQKRVLIALASYDFEHWTDAVVMGFRRDDFPPRAVRLDYQVGKQVHLGAGLWDRGNVVLGLYGQWNAPMETGDRREMRMDIGLVITHDGMHYQEPIPDFKLIDTAEEGWTSANPHGDPPRFAQGQGMANIGDKTITWYSIWGRGGDNSVRAAYWRRDRLGYFSPTRTPIEGQTWVESVKPHLISAPIHIGPEGARVYLNASGLSAHSRLTVELLDERFERIPGYTAQEFLDWDDDSSVRLPVRWREESLVRGVPSPIRIRIDWDGLRLEDARVYAIYVEGATTAGE